MATLDPSIIMGIQRPKLVTPQELYSAKTQIDQNALAAKLGGIQLQQAEQGQADQTALRDAYKTFGTDTEKNVNALYAAGQGKAAQDYIKQRGEQQKTAAETEASKFKAAKDRFEVIGQNLGFVKDNPTIENATAAINNMVQMGIMPPEVAQQKIAEFQQDPTPEGIQKLATLGYQGALSAKDQISTFETRNLGGTTQTMRRNPVTGKAEIVSTAVNTQSPDSVASNARMAAEGAANRDVQIRGQDKIDARARETTAATMSKPFEITGEDGKPVLVQQDKQGNIRPVANYLPKQGASKPLTEGQSKALLFGSRMQETSDIIDKLATEGVNKSIPGSRAGFGVGAVVNAAQPQNFQRLDQAKRDFINAVLRRESGAVISDQEFANAEQQYFPQIGEGKDTIAQKKRAREVATRGILAEVPDGENRVKKVRDAPQSATPDIDALLKKYQ